MPDLLRLVAVSWNGLPIVSLAFLAFGGLMYVWMSRAATTSSPTSIANRRPGWIARRRARAGITHRRDRVGVGYVSATQSVHLTVRELAGHGLVVGGPGSGKTTFLQLLIEASAGQVPVVVVDPKGSPALEETVRAHDGVVWTLDGKLPADLLDPRPWQVPDLLLEAEDYSADARVYRDAAHQRALWAAWVLALEGAPMDLASLRRLLDRAELTRALERHRDRDPRIDEWLQHLQHQHGGVEDSGARGLDRALGVLLDGVAMRGSLRTCPEALRLDDIVDTNGLVLFKLDAADYPHATRKVATWVLLGMGRVARQLTPFPNGNADGPQALLLIDEVGALGHSARHLRGLVGRARESGLAVVLATQGPSDLEAVDRALLPQVLQDTAWQLAFRQGSPQDAERMQALFGQHWVENVTRYNHGRSSYRHVERPRVSIDEWMNALQPGDAWLRAAPVDRGWRQERVRVALPRPPFRKQVSETALGNYVGMHVPHGKRVVSEQVVSDAAGPVRDMHEERAHEVLLPRGLQPAPTECPPELLAKIGADILAKVEQRWASKYRRLGPCLVWREGEPTIQAAGNVYGRIYDPAIGRSDAAHRVVYRRCFGEIPKDANGKPLEVDHKCDVTLCQRPDHLQVLTKPDNVKRRGPTRGKSKRVVQQPATSSPTTFAIALFDRIDRPQVQPKTVSLDELVVMLTTFETLNDKRHGGCWSPTKYADGTSTRGNAGVESVSCLVFDLDRVPPDPKRLEIVCWIGHTTWSHTPVAPRWRVVIPLARPVVAADWRDVWQRARAALCPEADPACKDPSRAYWLPSHPPGAKPETVSHAGPLLEPSTLPELPAEPRRPTARRVQMMAGDRHRAAAYMARVIETLATAAPGGRNAALNHAAWTLGRWVAAGLLEQTVVEDELYAAGERNGLVADDGHRQVWATIRSGLSAGLQQPLGC
jgi:hypothetical protein